MLDLHCHILPGVDDGAVDLAASVAMARALLKAGFAVVAASPHMGDGPGGDVSPARAAEATQILEGRLRDEGMSLEVLPGGEHYLSPLLFERLKQSAVVPIGGTGPWLMVELPWHPLVDTEGVLFRLQAKGYNVLLAHVERYPHVDRQLIDRLVQRGVRIQLELGSFVSLYGEQINFKALMLADAGLAHILATDLHDPVDADAWLPAAIRAVVSRYGKRALEKAAASNPRALLGGASPDDISSFAVPR